MKAKKSFSQHFLMDKNIVAKIVEAAEIHSGEAVLEMGPGRGVLTEALVESGARVTAIEADRDLIDPLRKQFGISLALVFGDALKATIPCEDLKYKLVANIPYHITSQILERFLTVKPRPSRMVLMVQREVADRILSFPTRPTERHLIGRSGEGGDIERLPRNGSLLSIVCQIYADCRKIMNVSAHAFAPAPKVDSAVIRLDVYRNAHPELHGLNPEAVIQLAKMGFQSRRKQLHRNLTPIISGEKSKFFLQKMGLSPTARAQELTVRQWIQLYNLSLRGA